VGTKKRKYKPVQRLPVTERMVVYRFMCRDSMDRRVLEEELRTEEEAETGANGRERKHKVLRQSRSMFAPTRKMVARWRKMRRTAEEAGGELQLRFVAELEIGPDEGFYYEVDGNGGHLPVWGETSKLAARVIRVVPGETMIEEADHDGI
jgi:hypothetical protein